MKQDTLQGKQVEFVTEDGWKLVTSRFDPASEEDNNGKVIAILPAMGSHSRPARFMASHFATLGYTAYSFDPRGHGLSGPKPRRGIDYGFNEFLYQDLPALEKHVKETHKGADLILIGHSLGGHMAASYAALPTSDIKAVVTLTSAHLDNKIIGRPSLLLFSAFTLISKLLGYLPGQHFGWGNPIARQQVLDWARFGFTGKLRDSNGKSLDDVLATSETPTLCIGFTDDVRMAPPHTTKAFADLMPETMAEHWAISPEDVKAKKLGHFEHMYNGVGLWDKIATWLAQKA